MRCEDHPTTDAWRLKSKEALMSPSALRHYSLSCRLLALLIEQCSTLAGDALSRSVAAERR